MQIGRARRQLPLAHRRNSSLAIDSDFRVDNVRRAVFLRLFDRAGGPVAGVHIVSDVFIAEDVQRDPRELAAAAAVAEQNFIVGRDIQQRAEVLFCLFCHLDKLLTTVTDLHDRRTQTVPVAQFLLSQFEYFRRQHCRARTEVIDLSHFPSPRCYVVLPANRRGHKLFLWLSVLSFSDTVRNG